MWNNRTILWLECLWTLHSPYLLIWLSLLVSLLDTKQLKKTLRLTNVSILGPSTVPSAKKNSKCAKRKWYLKSSKALEGKGAEKKTRDRKNEITNYNFLSGPCVISCAFNFLLNRELCILGEPSLPSFTQTVLANLIYRQIH